MSKAISIRIEPLDIAESSGIKNHVMRKPSKRKDKEHIDRGRSHLNSVIIEPPLPTELRDEMQANRKRNRQRAMMERARIFISGVITFGHEAKTICNGLPPSGQDEIFKSVAERLARESGHPLIGLVVHRDETSIHAHFVLRGFRIAAGGKEVPWRYGPEFLAHLQTVAAEEVAHLGIERGKPKTKRIADGEPKSAWLHRSVKQLHHDLPAEIAELQKKAEAAKERADKNERLAEKAEAKKKDIAEKYRNRQQQAMIERDAILAEIPRLQETLSRLTANANAATEAKEAAKREIDGLERLRGYSVEEAKAKAETVRIPTVKPSNVDIVTAKKLFGQVETKNIAVVPVKQFLEYENARKRREEAIVSWAGLKDADALNRQSKLCDRENAAENREQTLDEREAAITEREHEISRLTDIIGNRPVGQRSDFRPWSVIVETKPIISVRHYLSGPDVLRNFQETQTRYSVIVKIMKGRILIPDQRPSATERQIAAALYRVAQERADKEGWPGIVFTVSSTGMAEMLHEMAREDGIEVGIQFHDGTPFSPPRPPPAANDEQPEIDAAPVRRFGR